MKYLVHGATGAQGHPVFNKLSEIGLQPKGLVRNIENFKGDSLYVDLTSTDSLKKAYLQADFIFIHLPQAAEEIRSLYAENISDAVNYAKPKHIVISTSGDNIYDKENQSAVRKLIDKIASKNTLVTILEPCLFLDNLLLPFIKTEILQNQKFQYPIKQNYKISWTSHLNMANIVAQLATSPQSGAFTVGAYPGLSGEQLATEFSSYLNKEISFEAIEPKKFGTALEPYVGQNTASRISDFYSFLQNQSEFTIDSKRQFMKTGKEIVQQWLINSSLKN